MSPSLLDILLNDDAIQSLLQQSEDLYWSSQIDPTRKYSRDEFVTVCRLGYLLSSEALLSNDDDFKYANKAYNLLKTYPIKEKDAEDVFDQIAGYNLEDKQIMYFFYMASLALKMDKTISARLLLKEYVPSMQFNESNWGEFTLYSILRSLLLLVRKHNGFDDIRQAIKIIETLRKEQNKFEDNYISKFDIREQQAEALSLVGIYHASKAVTETAEYLISGYTMQQRRITSTIRQHFDIALELQDKDSRLRDILAIVRSDLQIMVKNSIWTNTGFQDKVKELCKRKAESGILELLPSQQKALDESLLNIAANAIVLQMPTSAGKTLMAEFNILVTRSLRLDSKIIYVVPSRALMNQVFFDLRDDLHSLGIAIERTSAAVEVDPTEDEFLLADNIDILVTTPEKLDLLIRRRHPSVDDVSLFIIDEAHTIENGQRGARLELLLTMLKRERPGAKYMLLSPFLPNGGDQIKDWLGGGNAICVNWKPSEKMVFGLKVTKKKAIYTILPTPHTTQVKTEKSIEQALSIDLCSSSKKEKILEYIVKNGNSRKTNLVLCQGRVSATNKAKEIAGWLSAGNSQSSDLILVQKYLDEEIGCPTIYTQLLSKGVAVHHAGLSDESKILIEHLIRKGEVQYVCATTTIAEGVNFPVSSVYFDSFRKGTHLLSTNDFWNISGRAGRTMVDDVGKIILPFHDKNSITTAKSIIAKSAEDLCSVLASLFINREDVLHKLNTEHGIYELIDSYPESFVPLFQYFVHLLNVSENDYSADVADLFKDTLVYNLIEDVDKSAVIDLCKQIYLVIQTRYSTYSGAMKYADKTGFSVPSVLKIMREKAQNDDIANIESWEPSSIFNAKDSSNLANKIKVISELKETEMGTQSNRAPFNADLIAKMLIGWVKGDKLNSISTVHPYFKNVDDATTRVSSFIRYMNDIRFKASWGLSALEGVVRGNEDDMKDTYIPSFVYYGVDDKKSLAMRMLGVPRLLSASLSQIIEGNIANYSFSKLRNNIQSLQISDWDSLTPHSSKLSGGEWRRIVQILMR